MKNSYHNPGRANKNKIPPGWVLLTKGEQILRYNYIGPKHLRLWVKGQDCFTSALWHLALPDMTYIKPVEPIINTPWTRLSIYNGAVEYANRNPEVPSCFISFVMDLPLHYLTDDMEYLYLLYKNQDKMITNL